MPQLRIPAVHMRGGTSKGLFFRADDLPADHVERDRILLRAVGSPDPYGKHIDGLGGATSSTSKVVILAPSSRNDCDVDYLFGQVAIDRAVIDWSGNCGNLTSAVGPFAVSQGWVKAPLDGVVPVRIWQANIRKRIIAHVPVRGGEVLEEGDFVLDGVAFPSAEIRIEFLDPGGLGGAGEGDGVMFPTGRVSDRLHVAGVGTVEATLITAGNPTVFVAADAVGMSGIELSNEVDADADLLGRCEAIRAHAAVAMGMASTAEEASRTRLHVPKIAMVAAPRGYAASNGRHVGADDIDLAIRMVSMGRLHHAVTGTGAIATAVASAIAGTVPNRARRPDADPLRTRLGHPSGAVTVGADVTRSGADWMVTRAVMSRSARRLMEGWVRVPADGPAVPGAER
jgi:probable AcnD-accessory protein PrpF